MNSYKCGVILCKNVPIKVACNNKFKENYTMNSGEKMKKGQPEFLTLIVNVKYWFLVKSKLK